MLRLPLETEFDIATTVAKRAGLGLVTPELLHLGNHTTAKLAPLPVVARIASGTSFDFSSEGIPRELGVASHLALRKAPTIRPSTMVDPGPYLEGECVITLWDFVDGRAAALPNDANLAAGSLKQVHDALCDIEITLPTFMTKIESCHSILSSREEAPALCKADRDFLREIYIRLHSDLQNRDFKWQPLHGDTHLGNVLVTNAGAIWMDLEAACVGPVEWDVINLPEAVWPEFGSIDPALTDLLSDVRSLCLAVWCWAEFDRSEACKETAIGRLALLKDRFR